MKRILIIFFGFVLLFTACKTFKEFKNPHKREICLTQKYRIVTILNARNMADDDFKVYVLKMVASKKWIERLGIPIDIRYQEVERLHIGKYLARAYIYYKLPPKREKK